ncbi:MAG: AAA family ATPase [Rickettsiales bacterium]
MNDHKEDIKKLLANEFRILWLAHKNVGLDGYMNLYTNEQQIPFRSKEEGLSFWFNEEQTEHAIEKIIEYYQDGRLPNSTLLLNPIIHHKDKNDNYKPIGSGIVWCSALSLGVNKLNNLPTERLDELGVFVGNFNRGGSENSGLKVIGFCNTPQPPLEDGRTVEGCRELYEITDIQSDLYASSYFLSGISYLTNNGLFQHDNIMSIFAEEEYLSIDGDFIKEISISSQRLLDADKCWNAYERHHSLYKKFGINIENIDNNLRLFNMVAKDINLFDAAGSATSEEGDDEFHFLIPGLLPRGSVSLLAAANGAGKSTISHELCVITATDHSNGNANPTWLGQPVDISECGGVTIFFSGEDGHQIFRARAKMLDPENKANRLVFQRTDFGEHVSFSQHMKNLRKIPDVPLIVIDPARKYLSGDEDNAQAVSDFFDAIEDFAIEKNSAILVVHHLSKGSSPQSAKDVLDCLSGSPVFVDRPRVVIGMYNDGPYVVAGLSKNNIPPNLGMVTEERVFARNPKNLSLIWLPGEEGIRNAPLSEEAIKELSQNK